MIIKADETGVFTGNVTSYRQDDEKWADDKLVMNGGCCIETKAIHSAQGL